MEKALPWIVLTLALSLGMCWLLIRSLVKAGAFSPKACRALFGIAVGVVAFGCVLGVLFSTVLDPRRDIFLLLGISVVASICVLLPLAIRIGKTNRAERNKIEEQQEAEPSLASTAEKAEK